MDKKLMKLKRLDWILKAEFIPKFVKKTYLQTQYETNIEDILDKTLITNSKEMIHEFYSLPPLLDKWNIPLSKFEWCNLIRDISKESTTYLLNIDVFVHKFTGKILKMKPNGCYEVCEDYPDKCEVDGGFVIFYEKNIGIFDRVDKYVKKNKKTSEGNVLFHDKDLKFIFNHE